MKFHLFTIQFVNPHYSVGKPGSSAFEHEFPNLIYRRLSFIFNLPGEDVVLINPFIHNSMMLT
jgi:hypothetical protein